MKKILCCIVTSVILIMSLTPCCVFAESSVVSEICETFENDASEWNFIANSVEKKEGAGYDGGSCGYAKEFKTENVHLAKGNIYRVSGWIKIDSPLPSSAIKDGGQNFRLQWYHNGDTAAGVNFKDVAKMTLKYSLNQWQYFEHDFFLANANGFTKNEITTSVFLKIMSADGYKFWLDDYAFTIVSPLDSTKISYTESTTPVPCTVNINTENEKNMRLVKGGSFEDNFVSGDWTMSDAEATPSYFGAENTMTALKLDMKANGTFGQSVATQSSSEYVGTLYTKQTDGDTAVVSILANGTPVTAATENADGWIKHTFEYTATGTTEFAVTTDADSVFYIDEFSVEPKTAPASLYADNIKLSGKLLAGENVSFNWGYSKDYSGRAMVKVYEYADNAWAVKCYKIAENGATSYTLPVLTENDEGKKFKVEILPIDAPQGTTVKNTYYETATIKKTFDINTDNFTSDSTEVSATVEVSNFTESKDILVTICLYNAKKALIGYDYVYIPSLENSLISEAIDCVKTQDSAYAKVFIWEGTDIISSNMSSLKEASKLELN